MSAPPPARPIYLGRSAERYVFGTFHPVREVGEADTAVVICPPWGWNEVTTYRSRKAWAEHLAARGIPTLRIDLPGSGDSAGRPDDPKLVEAWRQATGDAVAWMVGSSGARRVAVIGLGLGGLLAGSVLADRVPIDDLILWATPARGRAFLREQRAFERLQSSQYGLTGAVGSALPDGATEIGGFLLAGETSTGIERLDLREINTGTLQRALLLDRDGLPGDADLRANFEAAGVDVTVANGPGWAEMCFHPERYAPPTHVFEVVSAWLASAPTARAPFPSARSGDVTETDHLELVIDGTRIREAPLPDDGALGGAFGILSAPTNPRPIDVCAIYLNAGAVRRIGPNRMWVEAARRWAARGMPSLRVDVDGIGDADGDPAMYRDVSQFYTPDRGTQVTAIIDYLAARGYGPGFALVGLCAGAYSALQAAAADERVVAVVALNPRIIVWDPTLLERRDAMLLTGLLGSRIWRRILRGQTGPGRALEVGRLAARQAARSARARLAHLARGHRTLPWVHELEGLLDRLGASGDRVVIAFCGDEPAYDEMAEHGFIERASQWPNVHFRELPGQDHTLRPLEAQAAMHEMLDAELDLLVRAPLSLSATTA